MDTSVLNFQISINRRYAAEKLAQGDRRFAGFNNNFRPEHHTIETLAAEIAGGRAFCPVLSGCDLEHCGAWFC